MTRKLLLAATALAAIGFAGAASAQVVTNVTISGQSRTQNTVAAFTVPADAASAWTGGAVTAPGTTAAAVADTQYLIATESQATALNRATSGATSTTARWLTTGTGGANVLGLLGGNTYQVTLALTGAKFSNSVPATAISFVRSDGTTDAAASISGATVVSGGAAGDTSVTIQFTVAGAVDGRSVATSVGGFTINHPMTVDAYGTVGVTVNTALVVGAGYTGAGQSFAGVLGTAAQRTRSAVVNTVQGYEFVAGGVANVAANAPAFATGTVGGVDRLVLGTTAPAFRAFDAANDGIGQVNFRARTQDGANTTAFVGMTGQTIPTVTYDVLVTALNGSFGTTVNSLRPGAAGGANAVGTYTVATGGASASLTGVAGGTPTTTFINQGAAGTPTASLATVDQRYSLTVTPQTASAGLVTLPGARVFSAQSLTLEGSSYIAPWVTSSGNYNTVLRFTNNGTRAIGPFELSLSSPAVSTSTSSNVCRSDVLSKLGSIAVGGEIAISSADLTTCFGNFTRGDLNIRILDTVPAGSLTGKLRVVSPGGVVAEQTLGNGI